MNSSKNRGKNSLVAEYRYQRLNTNTNMSHAKVVPEHGNTKTPDNNEGKEVNEYETYEPTIEERIGFDTKVLMS